MGFGWDRCTCGECSLYIVARGRDDVLNSLTFYCSRPEKEPNDSGMEDIAKKACRWVNTGEEFSCENYWQKTSGFQKRAYDILKNVPRGHVTTYGEIAKCIGCGSARPVGGAMNSNRIPLVVPCHRVVGAGGALGGYAPGSKLKRTILEKEGVRFSPSGKVDASCILGFQDL